MTHTHTSYEWRKRIDQASVGCVLASLVSLLHQYSPINWKYLAASWHCLSATRQNKKIRTFSGYRGWGVPVEGGGYICPARHTSILVLISFGWWWDRSLSWKNRESSISIQGKENYVTRSYHQVWDHDDCNQILFLFDTSAAGFLGCCCCCCCCPFFVLFSFFLFGRKRMKSSKREKA